MEAALRERMQRKEYDNITSPADFATALTTHLREVSHDKHLRVFYAKGDDLLPGPDSDPGARQRYREMAAKRNFSFEKVERLSGNVGYPDLRGFEDPEVAAETAAAAMTFLANTDALIVDLRQNGGGDPAMVALLSSYSTVEDLLKFSQALRAHRLLSQKSAELIMTAKVPMGANGGYGYGFGDLKVNGVRFYGHNGGAPGITAELRIFPEAGYVIAAMSNYDPPTLMPVVSKITQMIANSQ